MTAHAEQASDPTSPYAGLLDAGGSFTCAVLPAKSLDCWGDGSVGQLGYAGVTSVGVNDTPASVGPVDLGAQTVRALATGDYHTCVILDDGSVRCWGFGGDGRLGDGSTDNVLSAAASTPVDLGPGLTATAITAGADHTCAILSDGSVRCWGYGGGGHDFADGRLGYPNNNNVGDTPAATPAAAGPVDLGPGRTAVAITAGAAHTCAILNDGSVSCWGYGYDGALGYGNRNNVGGSVPDYTTGVPVGTTPADAGPVDLGGQKAVAISAGGDHTCAILQDGSVRCWGAGEFGELGYGNTNNLGNTPATIPADLPPVNLGGHAAIAISAGSDDTCAILDDHTVRCWGEATFGRLGYPTLDDLGNQASILDPSTVGAVDLGAGRTAQAISAGGDHTCALLDNASVRCWGYGAYGQLGYCNNDSVGETNTPGSVGPVNLAPGDGGTTCPASSTTGGPGAPSPPAAGGTPPGADGSAAALASQAARARAYARCLRQAGHRSPKKRPAARRACLRRFARTPGPITGLEAGGAGTTAIVLMFSAPGTSAGQPPPDQGYLVKQSRHPIRTPREFSRAQTLCEGDCIFRVLHVGDLVALVVTGLRPHTTYYYAIRPRDNVTYRCGPRSKTIAATPGLPDLSGVHVILSPVGQRRTPACEALE